MKIGEYRERAGLTKTHSVATNPAHRKGANKMDAIIVLNGTAKEIAALALAVQGRQDAGGTSIASEREQLIREYERRLARLKSGQSAI